MQCFQVHQLLKFIAKLSEHPNGKVRGSLLFIFRVQCFSLSPLIFSVFRYCYGKWELHGFLRSCYRIAAAHLTWKIRCPKEELTEATNLCSNGGFPYSDVLHPYLVPTPLLKSRLLLKSKLTPSKLFTSEVLHHLHMITNYINLK
jgi:hypothetical protein